MGHAGAIVSAARAPRATKFEAFERAGVMTVRSPAEMG
jgi:succinyl-CoA synthetase alpha subunit